MYRIIFFIFISAAVLFTSCSEEYPGDCGVRCSRSGKVQLDVLLPVSGMTKATATGDESAVGHAQVFIFRPDGSLDATGNSDSDVITLDCTAGKRDLVAIVNAPDIPGVTDLSALLTEVSLLQDNAPGSLVMSGRKTVELTSSSEVVIPVERLVAKVLIERIVTDFSIEQYRDADFRITGIYLTNVAGDAHFITPGEPSVWYNRMQNDSSEENLMSSGDMSVLLVNGTPYETVHHFYCYPNPSVEDSFSEEWCPRHTRLVVETELSGHKYYYTMTMPVIEANHLYTVKELKITRPGASGPEQQIVTGDATFTIEVEDWEDGYSGSFEI